MRKFTTILCLFTACLLFQVLPVHAKTKDLLEFTSGSHLIRFQKDSMYLASATHALKVDFMGGRSTAPVSKEGPFTMVSYPNVWEGIDIVYEKTRNSIVKSTYTVSPGTAPSSIRLHYSRPLALDDKGNLIITYDTGSMTESKPLAWQVIGGKKKPVMVAYNLYSEHEMGFTVGDYEKDVPLVIDPDLTWNTFIGGDSFDYGYGIAVDGTGNVYMAGYSVGVSGCPVHSAGTAALVARLADDGTFLWKVFLGEDGYDYGYAIAVDGTGNVYVAGNGAGRWGTPVRAYYGSGTDAFVAKLRPTDGAVVWNTFLGGKGTDTGYSVAVDSAGDVYVAGAAGAAWGTPVRAYYGSGTDAFVAKLDGMSGTLLWNTFLGGSGSDYGQAVTSDESSGVYVSGYSTAAWGTPVRAYYGSGTDAFVAKLRPTDGAVVWNTFLGGSGTDTGRAVAVDSAGDVYVAGAGAAWGTPVRPYYGSGTDAFVAKLRPTDGAVAWNTFLGGSGTDTGYAVAVDSAGSVCVVGAAAAPWGTPVRAYGSGTDAFVAKIGTDGTLLWNTFLGGSGSDYGQAVALGQSGEVYVAGFSDAPWGTPVWGYSYNTDAFVAKLIAESFALSISKTGDGTGSVTSSPAGIDCGETCSASFVEGTPVTLTAAAAPGSTFRSWTGCDDPSSSVCAVTVTAAKTVTARFTLGSVTTLTAAATGTGSGAVFAQGLTCTGNSCSGNYSSGVAVTITAVAGTGSTLTEFKGCDSVSDNVCTVAMTSDRNVMAVFTLTNPCTYTLSSAEKNFPYRKGTVNVTVKASGAVTCDTPNISSNREWIGTSITFKKNRGTIKVTIPANDTITQRDGTVTIQGSTFHVIQAGVPCTLTRITPPSASMLSAGGSRSFLVTAVTGCEWKTSVDSKSTSWLSATPEGSGSNPVEYTASENTTKKQRSGKITVYLSDAPAKKKVFTLTEKK